ncbi:hypothetical protein NDR87_19140 [Nocardia sp. CDC159]|uniref:Uncharacterized protein n=1 Tax=Nocardia pulmonis TaxID=2951408 RepID=A0A9X2EBM9_9NOCA|nr:MULTISPECIES: hypothetical protein [Nocardia]MCM6776193.1 hypothetical protein [Nocardia pulmonis]MCM6788481.1 hypothetical protein [Nocardia sp. CDC159]
MSENSETRRGPSFSLLLAGVLALLVSVWAFIGPSAWPAHSAVPIGWIVVGVAILVGVIMVISPRRKRE